MCLREGGIGESGIQEEALFEMIVILVVDDNTQLMEFFTLVLADEGYEVRSASNGPYGLDLLTTISPDLILLDIMMKPIDGWEVLDRIRGMPEHTWTPVIMITGKQPTVGEIMKYGDLIDGYVLKPVIASVFSAFIAETLRQKRWLDEQTSLYRADGIDEGTLNEFRRLSRRLWVGNQFNDLFARVGNEEPIDLRELEDELRSIMLKMKKK